MANIRALAAKCIFSVVEQGRSLTEELPKHADKSADKDKGLLQEICYGVIRFLPELEYEVQQLMKKPFVKKQRINHFLLLVGIYQIKHMRIPDHAAVSETVDATKALKCHQIKGVINGVLRGYQRNQEKGKEDQDKLPDPIKFNHPGWFINKVKLAYPNNWQEILNANQQKPPMWLRVNVIHHSVESYSDLLKQASINIVSIEEASGAILLEKAVDVSMLPGFDKGWVSIQDGAAQQAAHLLACSSGDHVLDCCAAPGGKTCHILERQPKVASMTAIDIEEKRLVRVEENLQRLNLSAKVIAGDASDPDTWWDGEQFDKILLDAPCSATGVIRRHPDIKWLRKPADIENLSQLQQEILRKTWSLLKPGGTLLYATCSILPEENSAQIAHFLGQNEDAKEISITNNENDIGWQILPSEQSMDGFYYAKLLKIK